MSEEFDPNTYTSKDRPMREEGRRPRATVYFGPSLERLHRTSLQTTFSLRLEESVRRLQAITRHLVPQDWTVDEWAVLVMALQYVDGDEEDRAWSTLLGWGFRYGGQVLSQYGLDVEQMARELRDLGPAVNIAVVEAVAAYWNVPQPLKHPERLELLGLIHQEAADSED